MDRFLKDELVAIIEEELAAAHAQSLLTKVAPPQANDAPALPDWTTHQPIDISERAQKMHAISMIANAYGWQIAITHFLRMKGVPYLSDLTDPQLDDLLDRMHGYVDAAETGSSLADCLPAL